MRTTFDVPKMDCPSEERLVRMALDPEPGVRALRFDLEARRLVVDHDGDPAGLLARLEPLGFGARLVGSEPVAGEAAPVDEGPVLRQLLAINAAMFGIELAVGLFADSTGVLADAADMLADALVYGLALYGVGRGPEHQRRAAAASGWLQLLLGAGLLVEVARRVVAGSEPMGPPMMAVSAVALAANLACVALLARHRTGGVHVKASWIFSTNDAIANVGVLVAGALVAVTGSALPDLLAGAAIGLLVLAGALRILRLAAPR
ncbi:MAG: cation transporter [Myxococcota bacterium]